MAVGVDEEGQLLERLAVESETLDLDLAVSGHDPRRVADVMVSVEPAHGLNAIQNAAEPLLVGVRPRLSRHRPPTVPFPRIEVLLVTPCEEVGAHRGVVRHDYVGRSGGDDRCHLLLGHLLLGEPVKAFGAQVLIHRGRAPDPEPAGRAPRPAVADVDLADVVGDDAKAVISDWLRSSEGQSSWLPGMNHKLSPEWLSGPAPSLPVECASRYTGLQGRHCHSAAAGSP